MVGDLLGLHEAVGIELRILESLGCFWRAVTASTLGFSGIRLRHANPPCAAITESFTITG